MAAVSSHFLHGGPLSKVESFPTLRHVEDEEAPSIRSGSDQDHRERAASKDKWTITERLFAKDHLHRALERPHLTAIAFSGTIGIGLFVNTGEIISIGGGAGCVLGFVVAGLIVIGVMRSLAEMVSVRPLFSALMDYPHTFVDPALGFAVGMIYWAGQCISMATLTSAAARLAEGLKPDACLKGPESGGVITGLLAITLVSNACGVRLYGNLERVCKWIKIFLLVAVFILMIVVNLGVGGYPTDNPSRNYTEFAMVPGFKPDGFNTTVETSEQEKDFVGISGSNGRFLAVWTCVVLCAFPCMGGDIVIVTAGEAKTPRKDLPPATRFMYLVPIAFNILGSFVLGFNINYADPSLARPWVKPVLDGCAKPASSPFVAIMKRTSIAPDVLPVVLNALFLFSAYTAANTALFVSSRTLFGLSQLYGNGFLRRTLGRTNNGNTPLAAICCCFIFGFLAYLRLADLTFDQPILSLAAFFTSAVACVYAAECCAYLRFKKGLTRLEQQGRFSRNSKAYQDRFYRAHWQPMWAWLGLIGSLLIAVFSGWPCIYILAQKGELLHSSGLKPARVLAWNIVGAYAGPFLFVILYLGFKFVFDTKIRSITSFEDEYELTQFEENEEDRPDTFKGEKGWSFYLQQIWSLVK